MRRRTLAALVLLAAALLAWRRRRARALPSPAAPPQATPTAATPPAPAARFVSVPWTLAAAPADRGELTIRYAAHPALELDRVDAQETPTQVFVTVLMRPRDSAAADPAAETAPHEATVPLSGPLGARELVHAPADPPSLYP